MKMTLKEMKSVVSHDVLKYIGPSVGGLLRNKLYTVKDVDTYHIGFFMPKGQAINIDKNDYALWEMHEAKGASMAKEKYIRRLTEEFSDVMSTIASDIENINGNAEEIDDILKDFPLDHKMKLLSNLSKEQVELLEFFHNITRSKLTVAKLVKAFKRRGTNGT